MEFSALAPWASSIVAAAALIISLIGNRRKAQDEKIRTVEDDLAGKADAKAIAELTTSLMALHEKLAMRVDALEDRTTRMETDMKHLPDKDATQRLETGLAELRGEMAVLAERIKPVAAIAGRLQEAMLEKVGG